MIAILRILKVYFLALAFAAIALMPFYDALPQTYMVGFGLLALPTIPITKIFFPALEGLLSTDLIVLVLIFGVSIIYAVVIHFLLVLLKKRKSRDGILDDSIGSSGTS